MGNTPIARLSITPGAHVIRIVRPGFQSFERELYIIRRRIEKAAALEGVDTLVSACPWSERPLTEQGKAQGIEVFDIFELVAEAAGFEV